MTDANKLTQFIHGRMRVILDPADYDRWLDGSAVQELLKPYPPERMDCYPVLRAVGNVGNTGPEFFEPIKIQTMGHSFQKL